MSKKGTRLWGDWGKVYGESINRIMRSPKCGAKLSTRASVVATWALLTTFCNRKEKDPLRGTAFPKQETLGKVLGVGQKTVHNRLECLKEIGLLKKKLVYVPGRSWHNIYILMDERDVWEREYGKE